MPADFDWSIELNKDQLIDILKQAYKYKIENSLDIVSDLSFNTDSISNDPNVAYIKFALMKEI